MAVVRELITLLKFQSQGIQEAQAGMATLQNAARALVASLAGMGVAFSIKGLAEAGDAMTASIGQIRASLEGVGGSAEAVYEKLYGISRTTGVDMAASVSSFTQMQAAVADMGGTSEQVLAVVQGMQQAGAIAGSKSTDVAEAMRQMGQALGSGKLNGDELRSVMERMAPLARGLAAELGVPVGQLRKMGEDGKLTSAVVFPALVRAAGRFGVQFNNLPLTMGRSLGQVRVVWTRFLADLDKNLGLSQHIARNLQGLSRWLEGLRSRLPAVGELVRELGGIDTIFRVLTTGAYAAAAAFAVMNTALLGTILRFAAIGIAIGALVLGLDDLAVWMQGGDSLLGEQFGEFGPVMDRIREALGPLTPLFEGVASAVSGMVANTVREFRSVYEAAVAAAEFIRTAWEAIAPFFVLVAAQVVLAFGNLQAGLRVLVDGLTAAPRLIREAWAGLVDWFGNLFTDIGNRFQAWWDRLRPIIDAVRGAAAAVGIGSAPGAPAVENQGLPLIPDPAMPLIPSPISYGQQFIPRMGDGGVRTANVNAPISNTINIQATGVSGAEVAAAAQNGVGRAMRASSPGEDFARAIGVASPRVEAAAA